MGKLQLKINKKAWEKGRELFATGYEEDSAIEPGRYNATIKTIDIADAKGEQNAIVRYHVPEANGGKGGRLSKFYNLESENGVAFFLRMAAKLGFDAGSLSPEDIPQVIEDIKANRPLVRIRVREKDAFTNVDLESMLQEKSDGDSAPADEEVVEEKPAETKAAAKKTEKAETKAEAKTPAAARATKKAPAPPADEEVVEDDKPPVADETEVELKPGMKVKAVVQGEEQEVTIEALHEAEQKVTVKLTSGKKFKVPLEKLSL